MSSNSKILSKIAGLAAPGHVQSILPAMTEIASEMGFDGVIFGVQVSVLGVSKPLRHVISGYPPEFQKIYTEQNFLAVDPTVAHCLNSSEPILWGDHMYSEQSRCLEAEAKRFGIGHGLSIPVHDSAAGAVSMISLARDRCIHEPGELRYITDCGILLANMLHAAVKALVVPEMLKNARPSLTRRELECLRWIALGKSNSVIAEILKISDAAVNFHATNIFKKLNVTSRAQAVAMGLSLRLISDIGNLLDCQVQ